MKKIKETLKKLKTDSFWNNLVKNSFWAFAGDSVASAIGLVVTIILIKLIGNEKYGCLVIGQTYMTIIDIIINVQSWKGVIQFGQKSLVEKNEKALGKYIQIGSILDVSTAILCGIIALILAPVIGGWLKWSQETIICAQILSVEIFSHLSGTSTAILRILNKFNLVALQKFLTAIVKISILLILLIKGGTISLVTATIAYASADIFGNILLVFLAFSSYIKKYGKRNLINNNEKIDIKRFVSFTLWGTVLDIVDIPVNYFDIFIVSLLGTNMVAVFKVFKQCISILSKVTSPIQQSVLPQFSELKAEGEIERGFRAVKSIRNVILKVIEPIALIVGVSSPLWLGFVYGEEYAYHWEVLLIYLLVQTFALSYTTIHPYFLSLDKAKNATIYSLISNIIYCVVAYILVIKFGMIGIIIAYFIQSSVVIGLKYIDIKKIIKSNEVDKKNEKI